MYYHLARTYNVTFDQKFLLTGHTQMERDVMHSTIERNLVCDLFTLSDYAIVFKTPRKNPGPYHVKQITFSEPFKLSGRYFSSTRPGKSKGDPKVTELKALPYSKDQVYYKLSHDADWDLLPQRMRVEELTQMQLFDRPLAISARKYSDAQQYFVSLPHA
ncbi:hypothetical protein RRG08_032216 [Elysia crispata]|uniref:Uncharacterized protein n=1 Tax=Elysia crispata TaxID=231223 RepID=A0AAE1ABA7_9GAST|nr:hypothetical protein RRG08_032216 [Elysia crispata]